MAAIGGRTQVIVRQGDGWIRSFNAVTGKVHWTYDCFAAVWVSPLIVDNKVYVADEDGEVANFRLTAEAHEPLREISFPSSIYSSPVFANGTLYVADRHTVNRNIEPASFAGLAGVVAIG